MEDKRYYEVPVICSNCGYKKMIEVKKGVRVTDVTCPNCELKELTTLERK